MANSTLGHLASVAADVAARVIQGDVSVSATHGRVMQALSLLTAPELAQAAAPWLARTLGLAVGRLPGLQRDTPLYASAFSLGFHALEAEPLRRVVVGRALPGTGVQIEVGVRIEGGARVERVGMDIAIVGRGPLWSTVARAAGWAAHGIAGAVVRAWLGALAARLQTTAPSSHSATAPASLASCQKPRGTSSATSSR